MLKIGFKNQNKILLYVLPLVILSFLIPFFLTELATFHDWRFFNAQAALLKSSIWHFNVWPIHDPWACGGTNVLQEIENLFYSPALFFLLFFPPSVSNLLGILLFVIIGYLTSYKYFKTITQEDRFAVFLAAIYVNLPWFTLHFAEGHVSYRSFLLMPAFLYCLQSLKKPKTFLYLSLLVALFINDGGFYTLIFCTVLTIAYSCLGLIDFRSLFHNLRKHFAFYLLTVITFLCLVFPKLYPSFLGTSHREPMLDQFTLGITDILKIMYWPLQTIFDGFEGSKWGFHEYGNYIGIFITVLFIGSLKSVFTKKMIPYFIALGLFFWVATGIGGVINPWSIFQKLPVINIAHIQSRYFIIVSLLLLTIIAFGLPFWKNKKLVSFLLIMALVEIILVNGIIYYNIFSKNEGDDFNIDQTITKDIVTHTQKYVLRPYIYEYPEAASKYCAKTSLTHVFVNCVEDEQYKGEVIFLQGNGKVFNYHYIPTRITFNYDNVMKDSVLQINTHHFLGWQSKIEGVKVISKNNGLVQLAFTQERGRAQIDFYPPYLTSLIITFLIGLGLLIILLRQKIE
ncbi:MAG: hypothetical protein ABII18_01900 [bacterium]